MQTKAEKYLIKVILNILKNLNKVPYLINLGAAKSKVVEEAIIKEGINFYQDRCDIEDCFIEANYVKNCYLCSLENMEKISNKQYDLAWANFVFEHIDHPDLAVSEIARILKDKGKLVISLSNPWAPEFIIAKYSPTNFHQLFRKSGHDQAYPVKYSYKSIKKLIKIMEKNNFKLIEEKRLAFTYGYLYRFPLIKYLSLAYDYILEKLNLHIIKGHVVLVLEKR